MQMKTEFFLSKWPILVVEKIVVGVVIIILSLTEIPKYLTNSAIWK